MLMDVLAGVVCGLIMGTVSLGAGIYTLYTSPDTYDWLSERLPASVSPTVVLLFLVFAIPPAWAVVGAFGGLLYSLTADSFSTGLGSSNYAYTAGIISLSVLLAVVVSVARRKVAWLGLTIIVLFGGVFGWLLPLIASWR
jgi:hypothetical protein